MMQSMWRGVAEGCALRGQCELYMHVYFLKVPLQGLENQVSTASSVAKPSSVTSTDLSCTAKNYARLETKKKTSTECQGCVHH